MALRLLLTLVLAPVLKVPDGEEEMEALRLTEEEGVCCGLLLLLPVPVGVLLGLPVREAVPEELGDSVPLPELL